MDCINGTRFGCYNCTGSLLFWRNQCFDLCPSGTYQSGIVCNDCHTPCQTCTSLEDCITCSPSFYLIQGTTQCVDGAHCPPGTYPDDATRICKKCHFACRTCKGSTIHDCIICNFLLGFGRANGDVGDCLLMICVNGMYLNIDVEANKASCKNCYKSCSTCTNYGEDECIQCIQGTQPFSSLVPNRLTCLSCSDMSKGYYTKQDGSCGEICGDGLNLGRVECDDGNLDDGDGCDSECKVEFGFSCYRREGLPDVCIDMLSPRATLTVKKGNVLLVTFTEKVVSFANSTNNFHKFV